MKNLVIIPTYNEKENIEAIITAVMELPIEYHVLVIDDGSPDGTAAIVKDLMANTFAGKLHLVERAGKLGLGTAYIAGFKWAIEHQYDYILRWMQTSRTTQTTCSNSTMHVPTKGQMWRLAAVT